MCLAAVSPLGSALSGSRSGLAMLSPAAALLSGKKKDKPPQSREQILYGSGG